MTTFSDIETRSIAILLQFHEIKIYSWMAISMPLGMGGSIDSVHMCAKYTTNNSTISLISLENKENGCNERHIFVPGHNMSFQPASWWDALRNISWRNFTQRVYQYSENACWNGTWSMDQAKQAENYVSSHLLLSWTDVSHLCSKTIAGMLPTLFSREDMTALVCKLRGGLGKVPYEGVFVQVTFPLEVSFLLIRLLVFSTTLVASIFNLGNNQ